MADVTVDGKPLPTKVEGLPTTGPMGKNPAISVGFLVAAAGTATALAVRQGWLQPIGPEMTEFFNQWGDDIAFWVSVTAIPVVQGWITRNKVPSPYTLARKYILRKA